MAGASSREPCGPGSFPFLAAAAAAGGGGGNPTAGGSEDVFSGDVRHGRDWRDSSDDSDGGDDVIDDDDDDGNRDAKEGGGGGREGADSQGPYASPGFGRGMARNGGNGGRELQSSREQQWQDSQIYGNGVDQYAQGLHRGAGGENGCGVSGRRDGGPAASYWELLRAHLSDPLTGVLMDDAMILSCGHSYASSGMQHVYRMKACGKCGQPILEGLVRPNLALRSAVQAFRREEESMKASKRRRERIEQDKCSNEDSFPVDLSRSKGVQFPFAVFDRVVIKGNKRTPERFVGRVAVVTAQCLNGWYVVKTLDNAESVKLQYRSLAKVRDGESSAMVSSRAQNPNWL